MKVLYADLEREWRGGQSQALLTLRGLAAHGHDVELLAASASPIAERTRAAGLVVHEVPRVGLRLWAAKALRRLTSEKRFQLLHLNEPHALSAAWMASAHAGMPLLLSRRIGFPLRKNPVSRARFRAVTRFIANSRDVAQSMIDCGIAAERISIVNEGVELPPRTTVESRSAARNFWKVSDDEFLFGCVSVFVPEKGQRHLIEALPTVREVYPKARLLLVGDGVCRRELEALAKRLRQTNAVLFPGFVKNVDQIYQALDAFVFPSEFEGLGTALQSAMAYELPCISTTRGALAEVVDDDRTALVAEPNAQDFAATMIRMLRDSALRQRLAAAGRREVEERFSESRMVENTVRVYEDVLGHWRAA
jgi:glycosyltransferase involved in cell wall biosynthesis